MASDTDICNLALGHISNRARLASLDPEDGTIEGKHCARFYPIARDIVLEEYDEWRFARTRQALATVTGLEDEEWAFAYNVPNGCLKAIKVVSPGTQRDHPGQPFVIEVDPVTGDEVLRTNVEDAVLHYIFRQTQAGLFSPLFVSALSWLLASFLAGPIVKGATGVKMKEGAYQAYQIELAKAKASQAGQRQEDDQYKGHQPGWIGDR